MIWNDLCFVQFRRRETGGWSYTVFKNDWTVFRSNNCLDNVYECIMEIEEEIGKETDASGGIAGKVQPGGQSVSFTDESSELVDEEVVWRDYVFSKTAELGHSWEFGTDQKLGDLGWCKTCGARPEHDYSELGHCIKRRRSGSSKKLK